MTKKKKMLMCAVAGALMAGMPQRVAASPCDTNIVVRLKESVADDWGKLSSSCGKVMALRSEMEHLPDSAWLGSDKKSQTELIREKVMKIRGILLPTSAQEIMKRVDDLDESIAGIDRDIHQVSVQAVFSSAKREKTDARLVKLREKKRQLMRERENAIRMVLRELETLGLRLSSGAEQCLFLVDARDLIDAVVVAKSIGLAVENLRALMATGDVAAARRYFGMYLVMVEVQKACFDIYLGKSHTGEWREKLERIECDAEALRRKAMSSAKDMSFTEYQRAAFARNAEVNTTTLNAVAAYKKILDQHESVIQAKADEAANMLLVAENSYRTVSLTDEFLSLIKSNQDSFEALLQLELPPIELVNDLSFQSELVALTKKITENQR